MMLRNVFLSLMFVVCCMHSALASDDTTIPHDWADVDPALKSCLESNINPPPSVLQQQGIDPDDPRLAAYIQRCKKMTSASTGQGSPQNQANSQSQNNSQNQSSSQSQSGSNQGGSRNQGGGSSGSSGNSVMSLLGIVKKLAP